MLRRGTARRLSVPLTAQDDADLRRIRQSPELLRELPGNLSSTSSEAAVVHAVMSSGMALFREKVEEAGYAALAGDAEHLEHQAAIRARRSQGRRPANADDA